MLLPSFHLAYREVRAARLALAAGAVVGLAVLGACADNGGKTVTAPASLRNATIGSGGFGQAQSLTLCVDASSPAGTYTFRNIALNRSFAQDGFNNALSGNGFWDGTFWNDPGDGGDGTTVVHQMFTNEQMFITSQMYNKKKVTCEQAVPRLFSLSKLNVVRSLRRLHNSFLLPIKANRS